MPRFSFLSITILFLIFSVSVLSAQDVKKGRKNSKDLEKSLKVDTKVIEFKAKDSISKKVKVTSSTSWKVVSKSPWLTVSPLTGTQNSVITIKTKTANSLIQDRTSTVKIVEETGLERIIQVTQQGIR